MAAFLVATLSVQEILLAQSVGAEMAVVSGDAQMAPLAYNVRVIHLPHKPHLAAVHVLF
jgi:hypothetical protein